MEATGSTYKLVTLSVDQELVDQINEHNKTSYTLTELEKATEKERLNNWWGEHEFQILFFNDQLRKIENEFCATSRWNTNLHFEI